MTTGLFNEAFEAYFVKYFGCDPSSSLIFEQIKLGSPVGISSANFLLRLLRARKRQVISPNDKAAPESQMIEGGQNSNHAYLKEPPKHCQTGDQSSGN
jgi:hypothetical protein